MFLSWKEGENKTVLTCFVSFLKCRFGKVLWKHIPTQRRGSLEDEVFKEFCLDPTHSRIFAPEYVHISIIIYTMQIIMMFLVYNRDLLI